MRWCLFAAEKMNYRSKECLVYSGVDITERKKVEHEILRKSKVVNGINTILREALYAETEEQLGVVCLSVAEKITGSKFGFINEVNAQGNLDNIAISDPGWEACRIPKGSGHSRISKGFTIHGIYGCVLRDGKGLYANDPSSHPNYVGLPPGHPPLHAFLGAPLVHEDTTIGIVALGNRPGGYTEEQLEDLEALTPAVVQAFFHKRAEQALKESKEQLQQLLRSPKVYRH